MVESASQPSQTEAYATIFGALSEPVRLEIVRMIAETDELPCTILDATLPIAKSTISYHVKVLARAGLITVRKAGRYYFYQLRHEAFEAHLPGFLNRLQAQVR